MLPIIDGRAAWIFDEDNYDTDNILGPAYITVVDPERLKAACMASAEPDFGQRVKPGDVLVAGGNFGYGHTHFSPFIAMRLLGITAVLAESFYPDFYTAETTNGMPLLEVPGILKAAARWDSIRVDWDAGEIVVNGTRRLPFSPMSQRTRELVECGGIIGYLKKRAN